MNSTWREELAWAAGFFDGEGHSRAGSRERSGMCLRITRNDSEVLYRFKNALLGMGSILGPYKRKNGGSDFFEYSLTGGYKVQAAIAMLWPFLGSIKKRQAANTLINGRWHPLGFCIRGHSYDKAGKRKDNGGCMECRRILDRKRRPSSYKKVLTAQGGISP